MGFNELFWEISEAARTRIGIPHDQARGSYPLRSVTVNDWADFEHCLLDYFYHHCNVIGGGSQGSPVQDIVEAKNYALRGAGVRNATIEMLFRNATTGDNRGMVGVLDGMANAIKQKYIEGHIANAFDSYITPCNIDEATEIIREFFAAHRNILPPHIDFNRPQYYAARYKDYLGTFAQVMASVATEYRKL